MPKSGYPIKMKLYHWVGIKQMCGWMQGHGLTTPGMDAVIKIIPDVVPEKEDLEGSIYGFARSTYGVKTVRFKAEMLDDVRGLFDLVCRLTVSSPLMNASFTVARRIKDLKPMEIVALA